MINKKNCAFILLVLFVILILGIILNVNTIKKSTNITKKDIESEITQIINTVKQENENENINAVDSDISSVTLETLRVKFSELGYDLNTSTGEVIYKDHVIKINDDLTIASIEELQTKAYYFINGINNEKISATIIVENPKGINKIVSNNLEVDYKGKKKVAIDKELEIDRVNEIEVSIVGDTVEKYKIIPISEPEIEIIEYDVFGDGNTRAAVLNFNTFSGENVDTANYYSLDKGETWTEYKEEVLNIDLTEVDTIATKTTKNILDDYKEIKCEQLSDINYQYTKATLLDWTKWYLTESGYYTPLINDVEYSIHAYVFNDNLDISSDTTYGDSNDIGTSNSYATNTVVVKVNGNLTVNSGVTLTTAGSAYGGPKGLLLYASETLTNNGTISMTARGAKAVGQDVYLYKNSVGTYEFVPSSGGAGGAASAGTVNYGTTGINRQTGGGGSGGSNKGQAVSGAGSAGTSYSGGSGGRWMQKYT